MFQLRPDQVADLVHYLQQPKCLNLSDPGTGKTPPTVVNQYRRYTETERKTVWVMPKALMDKNVKEICRFTPFTDHDVQVIDSAKRSDLQSGKRIMLMGPDRFKAVYHDIPSDYRAIDVDEFHMCFGTHASARTQAFYAFAESVDESVMMTGTLVNGRLDSAYPAIHIIEPNYYPFGFDQFMGAHAYLDEYDRPIAWHDHDRLRTILQTHGIRRTFEQVFGDQEVVREVQWVPLSPKQRPLYDEFEQEALLELENFMIFGVNPGVTLVRTRQIMEHPNDFPDLRDPDNLPRVDIMPGGRPAKLDALEIHFTDHIRTGKPVIVFATLVPQLMEIAALAEKMGLRTGLMYGETPTKERGRLDQAFTRGDLDVMVLSWPLGCVGWNWQDWGVDDDGVPIAGKMVCETDHVIAASLSYMDSDFIQGYRRTIRRKRSTPLRITTLAYDCLVERKVMSIQERKSRDANLVDPTREVLTFNTHEEIEVK